MYKHVSYGEYISYIKQKKHVFLYLKICNTTVESWSYHTNSTFKQKHYIISQNSQHVAQMTMEKRIWIKKHSYLKFVHLGDSGISRKERNFEEKIQFFCTNMNTFVWTFWSIFLKNIKKFEILLHQIYYESSIKYICPAEASAFQDGVRVERSVCYSTR
jgi:hypothetical protein